MNPSNPWPFMAQSTPLNEVTEIAYKAPQKAPVYYTSADDTYLWDLATELWAMAQVPPGHAVEDAIDCMFDVLIAERLGR